jgi:acyl-coenzyme A thioesterase PaaI-like protein
MSVLIKNPFAGKKGYNCFGCSPDNPIGLRLNFQIEGDIVTCDWTPGTDYQGWMNVLHGGIQATLMDEIAGWLVMVKLGTAGVTSRMEVNLIKTAHMNRSPFHLKAELKEMKENIAIIRVELTDNNGQLCADSLMHYYTWPEKVARAKMHYPGLAKFLAADENK